MKDFIVVLMVNKDDVMIDSEIVLLIVMIFFLSALFCSLSLATYIPITFIKKKEINLFTIIIFN